MGLLKLSLSMFCVLSLLIMLPSSLGQDSPQDYVDAHNAARARARGQDSAVQFSIEPIQPIQWDEEVANFARNYANERSNDCELLHSENRPYGENLAMSFGEMTGVEAVEMWVNEQQFYDYDSNTCAANEMCGHYTQVVWNNSTKVGCAKVRCNNGGTFITCNYSPPGNFVGERPY